MNLHATLREKLIHHVNETNAPAYNGNCYDVEYYEVIAAACLAGIYHLTTVRNGADCIANLLKNEKAMIEGPISSKCSELTFNGHRHEVINSLYDYLGTHPDFITQNVDTATQFAYRIMLDLAEVHSISDNWVAAFIVTQRRNIVPNLPNRLQLGYLLGYGNLAHHELVPLTVLMPAQGRAMARMLF